MIQLPEAPRLMWPTVAVQTSYLVGEQADCLLNGTPADWLGPASEDFAGFVAERRGVRTCAADLRSGQRTIAQGDPGERRGPDGRKRSEDRFWITVDEDTS